jgi:hypothetical protein
MLCFVLWALCCNFLSIKICVCTWVDLLFVNKMRNSLQIFNCLKIMKCDVEGFQKILHIRLSGKKGCKLYYYFLMCWSDVSTNFIIVVMKIFQNLLPFMDLHYFHLMMILKVGVMSMYVHSKFAISVRMF